MQKRIWKPIPLFFSVIFLSLNLISVAYAEGEVNILEVPQQTGEMLGIPEPNTALIGGFFLSCIMFLTFVMPTLLLRNKAPALIMSLLVLFTLACLNWIPVWSVILILVLIASMFASKMKRVLS